MLKKIKDIALGTRMAGRVINRRHLISIAAGVVRPNNPNLLKEYGGDLVLTDKWAGGILEKRTWSKRKGTTEKVDPSPQFLAVICELREIHVQCKRCKEHPHKWRG